MHMIIVDFTCKKVSMYGLINFFNETAFLR